MTSLASREMTEQEMINTSTAPQMAHMIQVLRQIIRNKDKEIERWVDMVSQLQRDGELDPPEPKPLLADAKVGDLCQRRDGKWVQICEVHGNSVFRYPNPIKHTHIIICDETGDTEHWGKVEDADIISCEPLADEGSAEWALQMMKLGKTISRTDNRKETYVYRDGKIVANEWHCADQQWFLKYAEPTGWQLYEELEYKVGDYIKDGGDYYIVTSPTTCAGLLNGKGYEICPKTCKIVSPSEVVLNFGSGIKGTVRSCEHDGGCVRVISGDRVIAHIMTDVLEQPTRNLVRLLLKAQEDK